MDALDLVGLRYSSAKPPNPSWIAWGTERSGALAIDGVDLVGATVAERLDRQLPRVLAIDVPFGVPQGLARAMVPMVTNGWQVIEHLVITPGPVLDTAWAEFSADHPGALRLTEAISHGTPGITAPRPPNWRHLRALAKILWGLRDRVAVLPFDALELSPLKPMVLEVSPATLLRVLGLPYRFHGADAATGRTTEATAERLSVVRSLADAMMPLGVTLELPAAIANTCAHDAAGDALCAVLALVSAQLATRGMWTPPGITGPQGARALVEGWIVRPG